MMIKSTRSAATALLLSCSLLLTACAPAPEPKTEEPTERAAIAESGLPENTLELVDGEDRVLIYQLLPRLFGNTISHNRPWGTAEENGVGRFADISDAALQGIRELGVSHVWYTGVLHHALVRDYTEYGIDDDDPDVVKGRAGSPYAIKDYFSVNPDLALDPARRLDEFRALVQRTHANGMKVIIDIVPNHVARNYRSLDKPAGVIDFGENDDRSVEYARDNSFYYVLGEAFRVPEWPDSYQVLGGEAHPLADGHYEEYPARWTGNDVRSAQPDFDDWYETVKLNFGVRPDGSRDFDSLPDSYRNAGIAAHAAYWQGRDVPATWLKFRQIVEYWLDLGVDGFRYDMAEMVPVEFWSYLNSHIKSRRPDALLVAEIYTPDIYRDYLELGLMDLLYDKVDLYDSLKLVMQGRAGTGSLEPVRARLADIDRHLLRFLENHDEQRIASPAFAGDAAMGRPAMLTTAALGSSPLLLYFGQELGEPGDGDAGFGKATRTTIFDYWGIPSLQRWVNNGAFDGGALLPEERALRDFHARLLTLTATEPAFRGEYALLLPDESSPEGERLLAFARWQGPQRMLVLASFEHVETRQLALKLPASLIAQWALAPGEYVLRERLDGEQQLVLQVDENLDGHVDVPLTAMGARILELQP